jgi:TonB-linked SusC/RagA family outer membrane protein
MKKNLLILNSHPKSGIKKLLLTMKLALIIVFLSVLHVSANVYSQTIINLTVNDMPMRQVLKAIEQQSKVRFFYSDDLQYMDELIDLKAEKETLSNVLDDVFSDSPLSYKVYENNLFVIAPRQMLQQQKRSGTITDDKGNPFAGVSVLIKGTTMGVTTDASGKYSIDNVPPGSKLIFSFIGYTTQEIPIDDKMVIDVVLMPSLTGLEEVVVVGYGTQKKVNLTGSVESVKGGAIIRQPVSQASQALVGLVPGLTAIQSSGQPGKDNSTLRIRGIGSIGASNDPLILIDGVQGDINSINSQDIEDISVLKDAASAAIYGSRASNGVILVTTKRAKTGKVSLKYSNFFGWSEVKNQPKFVGSLDYIRLSGDFTQAYYDNYAANMASDPDLYPDTDWIGELFTESGFRMQHNLSFSGGNETIKSLASISYTDESANIVNFSYQRVNGRVNTDIKISDKLDVNFDVSFVRLITTEPSYGLGLVREVYRDPPIYAAVYSDGSWGPGWFGDNGVAWAHDSGLSTTPASTFTGVLKLNYSPIKDLKFSVTYAPQYTDAFQSKMLKRVETISDWTSKATVFSPARNQFTQNYGQNFTHNFNALAAYTKSFKSQSITAVLGYEFIIDDYKSFGASRQDYPLEDYEVLDAGSAATALNNGSATMSGLVSYFGRLNYSLLDRYLFEANIRRDASSRFAPENQVSIFPSFSAGWRLSQESFIKQLGLFSNLKLRASWGESGNQQIGSNFPYAAKISLGTNNYLFNNVISVGATQDAMANPLIQWETTATTNFGVDAGFLKQRLTLTAEYYIRETKDILLGLPIPQVIGLSAPTQNAGDVKNTGIDILMGWHESVGEFSYSVDVNFSTVENEVTNLAGLANVISGNSIIQVGSPIASIYGLEATGIFQTPEEILAAPPQFGTLIPGNIRYKDQLTVDTDADGIKDAADGKINSDDRVIIGNPFPTMTYGINLGAGYKGFDLSVSLVGVGKRDLLLPGYLGFPFQGKIQEWALTECWSSTNTGAKYPLIEHIRNNDSQISSMWVNDASYLRVRNISLGYTLPQALLGNVANGLRVYFSGQNLFTFDKLHDGVDPLTPNGTDGMLFPISSVYTFGLEVQF